MGASGEPEDAPNDLRDVAPTVSGGHCGTSTPRKQPHDHRLASQLAHALLPRKEVIQPHVPVRLPCYDFVPVAGLTLDACLPKVGVAASSAADSHDVTGGVYKARERIHRSMLTCGY